MCVVMLGKYLESQWLDQTRLGNKKGVQSRATTKSLQLPRIDCRQDEQLIKLLKEEKSAHDSGKSAPDRHLRRP